jgi:hypothetical protein
MDRYDNLDKAMCKELQTLNDKYTGNGGEMSEQDVKKADMLYHALKSAETYYAMKDAGEDMEDYSERGGMMRRNSYRRGDGYGSYARGRSPVTGRYISRDMGYSGRYPMDYYGGGWDGMGY